MTRLGSLGRFFSVPPDNPELVQSQARGFTRQMPLMYAILLINTVILALTQYNAPPTLTIVVPSILALICAVRLVQWWRRREGVISDAQARIMLNRSVPVAGILGFLFCSWALGLYPYGDAMQQAHVAFYVGIT